MTKEKLDAIQEKLYNEMVTMPEERERLINDTAHYVAQRLFFNSGKETRVEFYEHRYTFMATKQLIDFKNSIWMVVTDENAETSDSSGNNTEYKKFNIMAEIDNTLSTIENYRACVSAFLRHQTGEYLPEELDEE